MTKKHFRMIAEVLADARNRALYVAEAEAIGEVAKDLADALGPACPRFDRGRFLRACGVEA